jgi:hypothetical protein
MFEFDTQFSINTGALNAVYTGSGVHLDRDVTFSFTLVDPQGNLIKTDADLIKNSLVSNVSFDILNKLGQAVFTNYKSGTTSRSLTLSEIENASIFGSYEKDFGVRVKVANTINNNIFQSDFFAYGNVPNISSFDVTDGFSSYLADDPLYDQMVVDLQFSNNLKYVDIKKFDLYVSTENDISLYSDPNLKSSDNPYYLYTQNVQDNSEINQIVIKPVGLLYDTNYYFTIVPYSTLGSGSGISFGPKVFNRSSDSDVPTILAANQLELYLGDEIVNTSLITGQITIPNSNHLLDQIESGTYNTILYTVQIREDSKYTSSELKLVTNGSSGALLESPITNSGQLIYSVDQIGDFTNVYVSGVTPTGYYKIYKISL